MLGEKTHHAAMQAAPSQDILSALESIKTITAFKESASHIAQTVTQSGRQQQRVHIGGGTYIATIQPDQTPGQEPGFYIRFTGDDPSCEQVSATVCVPKNAPDQLRFVKDRPSMHVIDRSEDPCLETMIMGESPTRYEVVIKRNAGRRQVIQTLSVQDNHVIGYSHKHVFHIKKGAEVSLVS